jgi:hypothetical protein
MQSTLRHAGRQSYDSIWAFIVTMGMAFSQKDESAPTKG